MMEAPAAPEDARGDTNGASIPTATTTSNQSPETMLAQVPTLKAEPPLAGTSIVNDGVNGAEDTTSPEGPTLNRNGTVAENENKFARPTLSVEEKLERSIAPVKAEYLWSPEERDLWKMQRAETLGPRQGGATGGKVSETKMSKRAHKKARAEARKTNVCGAVARTGDPSACTYGSSCRFTHDLTLFLEKKAEDLEGPCPLSSDEPCPFGVACRFATKHKTGPAVEDGKPVVRGDVKKTPSDAVFVPKDEVNSLDKDLQKQLWKGQLAFPRANAAFKKFGIQVSHHGRQSEENGNGGGRGPKSPVETTPPVQKKADHHIPSEKLASEVAQETSGVAEPMNTDSVANVTENGTTDSNATGSKEGEVPSVGIGASDSARKQGESSETGGLQKTGVSMKLENVLVLGGSENVGASEGADDAALSVKIEDAAGAKDMALSGGVAKAEVSGEVDDMVVSGGVAKAEVSGGGESGKRKLEGDDETATKRSKGSEEESVSQQGGVKLWDVNGNEGGVEGTERRGKRTLDFRGKLYLAPLTTVGNLPFRRVCLGLGADITCGEMAMATNLLQGQQSEWALLRRHSSEKLFGVQICGSKADTVARACEMITDNCSVDFVDINMGCPIDLVVNKGAGSFLLLKPNRIEQIVKCSVAASRTPVTFKVRTGFTDKEATTHLFLPQVYSWGASAVTVHGRSRQQRYSKLADWSYIARCTREAKGVQVVGNGDVMSFEDYNAHVADAPELATCMIARGALLKPWLFTEIKEQRHWDISAGERLDILRQYCKFGIEHWGSDDKGIESTRRFLLEWLSYLHRYVPVGLLEVVPQRMAWRPPAYRGRSDLEILMASDNAADWVRISEMLLGPAPPGFQFTPKHKSGTVENG